MAAPFMALHIAPHAKGLSTTGVGALVRLFARMRVAMDAQTARSTEGFVASRANVSILTLRIGHAVHRIQIVVVLPHTPRHVTCRVSHRHSQRRKCLWKRLLCVIEA